MPHNRVKVLIVDDHRPNLLVMQSVLELLPDVAVETASSGEEALAKLASEEYAVVLLDIMMPTMDGYEVARRSRANAKRRTPIIFVTAALDDPRFPLKEAYSLGAVDCITKPFTQEVLLAKVATFVELKRTAMELARVERERFQSALSEKDDRLRLLLDATKDYAFIMTGPDGRITEWEGGASLITGWQASDVLGRGIEIIFTPEDRAVGVHTSELETALRDGRASDKRWHLRSDGSLFFADGVAVALKEPNGRIRGFAKIFRDTTASRRAEEERARLNNELRVVNEQLAQVFNQAPAVMCVMKGPDHVFQLANDRYMEMTGRRPLIGLPARVALPDVARQGFFELLDQVYATGEPHVGTNAKVLLQATSSSPVREVFLDFVYLPLHDAEGNVSGVMLHAVDRTEWNRSEEGLRRLAADLSDVNKRQSEFLATLAHELRNPLAPLRTCVHLIRRTEGTGQPISRQLDVMERQLKNMVHLIDDLLDIARIRNGKLELKRAVADVREAIRMAVETSQPLIEAREHRLEMALGEEPLPASIDAVRIAQVVGNLLNNAAKYTPMQGVIVLKAERVDDQAVISVTDSGVGIPADALPSVFSMFAQAHNAPDLASGGLGIGLNIVQRLVEMHGGTVIAFSEGPGTGSCFQVQLPLAAAQQAPTSSASRASGVATELPLKVLVVDDNQDAAEALGALLEMSGHSVRVATSAEEALKQVDAVAPDVAFLDIGMPGMDGYELAQRLRTFPELKSLRLVALTGWGTEADRNLAKRAGFDAHLTKPADLDALSQLLASYALH